MIGIIWYMNEGIGCSISGKEKTDKLAKYGGRLGQSNIITYDEEKRFKRSTCRIK